MWSASHEPPRSGDAGDDSALDKLVTISYKASFGPGYDRAVRFRVVLFDLDGTLIDSGPIILASMQHAVRAVLAREIPYEELAATVGGQGLVAQMRELAPDRVDELVEAYRLHNDPLHDTLEAFEEMLELIPRLRAEGRRLGLVTAKRHRTVALALDRFPVLEEELEVVVAHEDTERHKPDPDPVLLALERLEATPEEAAYVGDSPFDVRAAKAANVFAVAVGWGGIHSDERLLAEEPDAFVREPRELLDVV
jgi:pyrophosphatase PpaX